MDIIVIRMLLMCLVVELLSTCSLYVKDLILVELIFEVHRNPTRERTIS